mgnify:CR=1 FL=1|jgi:hypothetical protein
MKDIEEQAKTQLYVNYLMDVREGWFKVMELSRKSKIMDEEWKEKWKNLHDDVVETLCLPFKEMPGAKERLMADLWQMWVERDTQMLCPVCKTELFVVEHLRLQNLSEHVSNPEGLPSLKGVYQCPKDDCIASEDSLRWDSEGGLLRSQ